MTTSLTFLILVASAISSLTAAVISIFALFHTIKNGGKVDDLHVIVNNRLTELLHLTEKSSHAEGVKDEKARSKLENDHF
jgi:hypothetical protein